MSIVTFMTQPFRSDSCTSNRKANIAKLLFALKVIIVSAQLMDDVRGAHPVISRAMVGLTSSGS